MTGTYNIISEYITLTLSLLILYLMVSTYPRRTNIYIVDFLGIIFSIVEIVLFRIMLALTQTPSSYNPWIFNSICMLFFMVYSTILCLIYAYIDQLSFKQRQFRKKLLQKTFRFSLLSAVVYAVLLFSGKMYVVTPEQIIFTPWFNVYLLFGMLACITTLVNSVIHRDSIARKMYFFIIVFCPFDLALLIFQFIRHDIIFFSITYFVPFFLFYILFHSNSYDEISGCQNSYSYTSRFMENVRLHRKFLIIYVEFPRYIHLEHSYNKKIIENATAAISRKIESLYNGIYLYTINDFRYALLVNIKHPGRELVIIHQVDEILSTPISYGKTTLSPVYRMIAFHNDDFIDNTSKLSSFQKFLMHKLDAISGSSYYIAKQADYTYFSEQYELEQLLAQIKANNDLNDTHVLCFAQPIYNVDRESFRTAEALMRLQIDGRLIFPDKFIPVAEQTNCIHALTKIILNKVCQEIHRISGEYDFDAITVNCSTTEFSEPNLYQELLSIIHDNHVDCSKICLELTESAMFEDYDVVLHNIRKLREAGVQFYLDDFGTGYSNLERILTCPFKTIKFDKSLLYKSMDDKVVRDLMVSMVNVFKRQGFSLLVEGVEDEKQNQYSIDKGFNYIQGYNYARPLPIEQLTGFFASKKND